MEKLRIKEIAREKGMTLISIARAIGITRFNMSAIASGARGVSLKVLLKIARILDCTVDELIVNRERIVLFRNKAIRSVVELLERRSFQGQDKTWVHRVMLARHAHYRVRKRIQ